MTDPRWIEVLRALEARKLNRRRLVQAGAAATAAATLPLARDLAAPRAVAAAPRAQSEANQLVVLDSLQTQNWLYMDPGKFYEINPSAALNMLYESLYHIPDGSKIGEIKPLLATDMPAYSSDGLTATIKIRDGVKFQNSGNPMTADDWVWSWYRLKNLKGNPSFLFTDFLDSVKAVDPHTLEIKLLSPNAALPAILSAQMMGVMDSKAGKANGGSAEEGADQSDKLTDWINKGNSIGTGMYNLTQWDISGEVILEKNPDYWGDAPKFDRIIFRNVADTSTQLQLLETGEADLAFAVDPDKISEVQSNPGLQLLESPSLAIEYVAMHTHPEVGGPLAKKEARQAIAHAIDYDGIITGLLGGHADRPATIAPLGLLATEDVKDKAYTTDIAKANELWKAAGAGTTELSLTYGAGQLTPAGLSRDVLAPKLQQDIQKIDGVTVKLVPMDSNERLQMYRDGKLQFTMSDWSPDYDDVHTYCDPFGHTGGAAAKRVGYSDPEVDKLLTQGIAELDEAKRKEIYIKIQEALIDAAAFLVEFQPHYLSPASKAVKGVQPHGIYILQLRYASKEA
jgi:peptide/nickel transport system substrate-binding protein